jgi:hypothetical protein
MFYKASSFNQPLNTWNGSSVIISNCMFLHAESFDKKNALWYNFD